MGIIQPYIKWKKKRNPSSVANPKLFFFNLPSDLDVLIAVAVHATKGTLSALSSSRWSHGKPKFVKASLKTPSVESRGARHRPPAPAAALAEVVAAPEPFSSLQGGRAPPRAVLLADLLLRRLAVSLHPAPQPRSAPLRWGRWGAPRATVVRSCGGALFSF